MRPFAWLLCLIMLVGAGGLAWEAGGDVGVCSYALGLVFSFLCVKVMEVSL